MPRATMGPARLHLVITPSIVTAVQRPNALFRVPRDHALAPSEWSHLGAGRTRNKGMDDQVRADGARGWQFERFVMDLLNRMPDVRLIDDADARSTRAFAKLR